MPFNLPPDTTTPFLEALRTLFAQMDQKYAEVAGAYGFECRGCRDNCCRTRFYHHTYLELAYLHQGLQKLAENQRQLAFKRAENVCRELDAADQEGITVRLMCPLNDKGLCLIYPYRPMICRMHGIAHELKPPGRESMLSPGCEAFTRQTATKSYIPFDRTAFYARMSQLEQNFRQAGGLTSKFKNTVAEMLLLMKASEQL